MRTAEQLYQGKLTLADLGSTLKDVGSQIVNTPLSLTGIATTTADLWTQACNRGSVLLLVGAGASVLYSLAQAGGYKRTPVKEFKPDDNYRGTHWYYGYTTAMPSPSNAYENLMKNKGAALSILGTATTMAAYGVMSWTKMSEGYKALALAGMALCLAGPSIYARGQALVASISEWWNKVPYTQEQQLELNAANAILTPLIKDIRNFDRMSPEAKMIAIASKLNTIAGDRIAEIEAALKTVFGYELLPANVNEAAQNLARAQQENEDNLAQLFSAVKVGTSGDDGKQITKLGEVDLHKLSTAMTKLGYVAQGEDIVQTPRHI